MNLHAVAHFFLDRIGRINRMGDFKALFPSTTRRYYLSCPPKAILPILKKLMRRSIFKAHACVRKQLDEL